MMRKLGWISATIVVLMVGLWARKARHPEPPAVAEVSGETADVRVFKVARKSMSEWAEATGTVVARERAEIAPKVMAKVLRVTVREGDRVRRGQLLVQLDGADLQAQAAQAAAAVEAARARLSQARTGVGIQKTQSSTRVAQAEAELAAAREQLSLVKEGPRKQEKAQADALVAQAEAALRAAEANLSMVREGARRQQKAQADEAVRQAQAAYDTAEATYQRFKSLYEQEVISKQRFDEVKMQRDIAKAQLEQAKQQASLVHEGSRTQEVMAAEEAVRQARANREMVKQQRDMAYEGSRQQDIRVAEAQVRQAEEALRMAKAAVAENEIKTADVRTLQAHVRQAEEAYRAARVMVGYTRIIAPFDGVVVSRRVDPGDMASPGMPVIVIESDQQYRLEATVPESRVAHLRLGAPVTVALDALGLDQVKAKVAVIVPSADPASRSVIVKVDLPSLAGLRSGMFGRLRFTTGENEEIVVPAQAIWRKESLTGVFVVKDGTARLQLVELGRQRPQGTVVLSGLEGGETIVSPVPESLRDGDKVRIVH